MQNVACTGKKFDVTVLVAAETLGMLMYTGDTQTYTTVSPTQDICLLQP